MVPQHTTTIDTMDIGSSITQMPIFGSQLIDKNSATPYSDATQVGGVSWVETTYFIHVRKRNSVCWVKAWVPGFISVFILIHPLDFTLIFKSMQSPLKKRNLEMHQHNSKDPLIKRNCSSTISKPIRKPCIA